jgi:hypothetical protein
MTSAVLAAYHRKPYRFPQALKSDESVGASLLRKGGNKSSPELQTEGLAWFDNAPRHTGDGHTGAEGSSGCRWGRARETDVLSCGSDCLRVELPRSDCRRRLSTGRSHFTSSMLNWASQTHRREWVRERDSLGRMCPGRGCRSGPG